ncbi:Protein-L-isoaspartate(D-aspartate) O-methyltransferase (PCMT) [Actinomadura madurae]|uniref:Protein-L-isoaspartate(D-aspartate) O-methyltransferase (PCMT) n=2 Tax=Actinomadura madurae TaxID=1993 RepID=A0A1I5FFE3_9ACTN|nr:Protein-L-isoaspartate(D-aspartate) O-methyltransferase (PCMT) [Actinomadura madurae]
MPGDGEGVDRRLFISEVVWIAPGDGEDLVPLRRADDPEAWERLVAADESVVTQVDDDDPGKWGVHFPTSSSTAPWLMRRMIEALDLAPGMAVLEIATGTGYNAALLAEAGAVVTTVEIDARLANEAPWWHWTSPAAPPVDTSSTTSPSSCHYVANA